MPDAEELQNQDATIAAACDVGYFLQPPSSHAPSLKDPDCPSAR